MKHHKPKAEDPNQILLPGFAEILAGKKPRKLKSQQPWITYGINIDWSLLESLDPNYPPVVLSLGMGVDSVAMLLRFLFEPGCRDFPLSNLVLVIAMTGDEWHRTAELMRKFVLPLCRRFGIWLIQVSRSGESERDGITIHSSTRCPTKLYIEGDYTLGEHLLINGIVPQKAKGKRFCTMKFKAFPIDLLVKLFFGDSPDLRYRRMIGFNSDEKRRTQTDKSYGNRPRYLVGYNADETERATKDSSHTTVQHYRYLLGFNHDEIERQKQEAVTWRNQVFEFPLILWGWGREKCRQYIAEITYLLESTEQEWVKAGQILDQHAIHTATPREVLLEMTVAPTEWEKSCCGYCPHSCSNGGDEEAREFKLRRSKRPKSVKLNQMILRWQREPEMGGYAAYIEHNALAFSHYSGALYDSGAKKAKRAVHTVLDKLKDAGITAAVQDYQRRVEAVPTWSVYVVRRVFKEAVPPSEAAKAKARAKGKIAKPTYPTPPRYVEAIFTGTKQDAHDYLERLAMAYGKKPQLVALSYRFWSQPRPKDESKRPFVEEMFVCVFNAAKDKWDERIDFEALWQSMTGEPSCVRTPFDKGGE